MVDQAQVTADFMAITDTDVNTAQDVLGATGFDLEQAVQLYFATKTEDDTVPHNPMRHPSPDVPTHSAAVHGSPARAPGAAPPMPSLDDGEFVRAPLPVTRERLYAPEFMVTGRGRGGPHEPQQPSEVEAFRDFRAEGSADEASRGAAEGSGQGRRQGLAGLFEPPRDLIFKGAFDQAKEAALQQSRWLLVNVQSNSEFASHLLNRDTWTDETVRTVVTGSFIFWQIYDNSEAGQKFRAFYRLVELPVIMVIDPVTGAALKTWHGAVEPQRLMEELVPFMDAGIHDPGAAQLSTGHLKRKQAAPQPDGKAAKPMGEDEELALALAMSAEAAAPAASAPAPAAASVGQAAGGAQSRAAAEPPTTAPAVAAAPEPESAAGDQGSAEAAAAAAAARLPPEPPAGGCMVAVRFPDGDRRSRRFPGGAPLGTLRDFCAAHSPEAAAGRAFALSESFPGAPALVADSQTLEESKLHGALLVMRWVS